MRKSLVLLSVLALTGCAATTPAPVITPVDLKYCALADQAGFDDDGLNRSVYAALQQLKVQTGASIQAAEVGPKLSAQEGIDKLIKANCKAIITAGEELNAVAHAAAKSHPQLKVVAVGDLVETNSDLSNYTAINFNIFQAAFAAGYLAAAEAETTKEIAVLDLISNSETKKSIKAFTAGVARFNTEKRGNVKIKKIRSVSGVTSDVLFALAGNSSVLDEFSISETNPIKIIGYGRDWYLDARNAELKKNILASVIRIDVISKVADAIAGTGVTMEFDLTNSGVGITAEHEISYPAGFGVDLDRIVEDINSGKVKVG